MRMFGLGAVWSRRRLVFSRDFLIIKDRLLRSSAERNDTTRQGSRGGIVSPRVILIFVHVDVVAVKCVPVPVVLRQGGPVQANRAVIHSQPSNLSLSLSSPPTSP